MMPENNLIRIKTITEFHALRGLPKPQHPLISIAGIDEIPVSADAAQGMCVFDFYCISVKRGVNVRYKYGQQQYDFGEGIMYFMAPGQVFGFEIREEPVKQSGWILLIHPDFLWHTHLGEVIRKYEFFDYAVNEALFLSEKEEDMITATLRSIAHEYSSNIDKFSQGIILSQIEVLLNYSERFYNRQFITRKIANHQILDRLEQWLDNYFNDEEKCAKGLPEVQEVAAALHISPTYLGGLLKSLTGLSTQQHIHEKLIVRAKQKLTLTGASISEIAYELGFEHPQSFSKLFKAKTNQTPLEFRKAFH